VEKEGGEGAGVGNGWGLGLGLGLGEAVVRGRRVRRKRVARVVKDIMG